MRDVLAPDRFVDLPLVEVEDLAERTASRAGRDGTPFGTYLFSASAPEAELGRYVERRVFGEVFGNSPALLAAEYGPYEATSLFVCVLDHRRHLPVGAVRLVLPATGTGGATAHLKSLDDLARIWGVTAAGEAARGPAGAPFDPARTWDIATLAVAPDYRRGMVSLALYQACCTAARRCEVGWFVTIVDLAVLRLLQSRLGRPFSPVPATVPVSYLDSPASLPCTSDLEDWSRRLLASDPAMHETLFEGRGLEPAFSPPVWDDVAALVERLGPAPAYAAPRGSPPCARARATSSAGTRSGPSGAL